MLGNIMNPRSNDIMSLTRQIYALSSHVAQMKANLPRVPNQGKEIEKNNIASETRMLNKLKGKYAYLLLDSTGGAKDVDTLSLCEKCKIFPQLNVYLCEWERIQ